MYIQTFTYGKLPVQAWEYPAIVILLIIIAILSGRKKRINLRRHPQYRYYLLGLWAKVGGGIVFALIYVLYYGQGDTTSYYECGLSFVNLKSSQFWLEA